MRVLLNYEKYSVHIALLVSLHGNVVVSIEPNPELNDTPPYSALYLHSIEVQT